MPYSIKQYTYDQAKKLGVQVKPSTVKSKKIDVYKDDKKVASSEKLHRKVSGRVLSPKSPKSCYRFEGT